MFFLLILFILLLIGSITSLSSNYNSINKNTYNLKKLASNNQNFVPFLAKSYIKKHNLNRYEKEELIQEGYVGFMRACQKYNQSRNVKITTYSSFWIRRYMTNYIQKRYKHKKTIVYDENIYNYKKDHEYLHFDYEDFIKMYSLTKYEKDLIYRRYVLKQKVIDIAAHFGYSRNTITNHYNKIKNKIRNSENKLA